MADYIALFSDGPDRPIVTHSGTGEAMVYTEYGTLAVASGLRGFKAVIPFVRQWEVNGTFGLGTVSEGHR